MLIHVSKRGQRTRLSYVPYIMAATQGVRASTTMILTVISQFQHQKSELSSKNGLNFADGTSLFLVLIWMKMFE